MKTRASRPPTMLVATNHDPEDRLFALAASHLPGAFRLYEGVLVICSSTTSARAISRLEALGAATAVDNEHPVGCEWLGCVRRRAVYQALGQGAVSIHLCDFDRLIHWQMTAPAELADEVLRLHEHDMTVYGRTGRALKSHPRCQIDTERLSNHTFALTTGRLWDLSGGSRGLSRPAAELVVAESLEPHFGIDAEWPMLVEAAGMSVVYRACDGLAFETPDRYAEEVNAAGGVEQWVAKIDASSDEWARRIEFAWWTAGAARRTADRIAPRVG